MHQVNSNKHVKKNVLLVAKILIKLKSRINKVRTTKPKQNVLTKSFIKYVLIRCIKDLHAFNSS